MANLDKAHKRIEQFVQGELSGISYDVRQALGRRLEVDARLRAIVNYLEELTFDVDQLTGPRCACGLPLRSHPAGISDACGPIISPGPVPVSAAAGQSEAAPTNTSEASRLEAPSAGLGEDSWDGSHPPPALAEGEAPECCDAAHALEVLRDAIYTELGWSDDYKLSDAGDYLLRLKVAGKELRQLQRTKTNVERAHANIQADRDRADSLVLAAREVVRSANDSGAEPLATSLAKLAAALTEYDDYIPF